MIQNSDPKVWYYVSKIKLKYKSSALKRQSKLMIMAKENSYLNFPVIKESLLKPNLTFPEIKKIVNSKAFKDQYRFGGQKLSKAELAEKQKMIFTVMGYCYKQVQFLHVSYEIADALFHGSTYQNEVSR